MKNLGNFLVTLGVICMAPATHGLPGAVSKKTNKKKKTYFYGNIKYEIILSPAGGGEACRFNTRQVTAAVRA